VPKSYTSNVENTEKSIREAERPQRAEEAPLGEF
jgi:hypothetical protein